MRAFVALPVPDAVRADLEQFVEPRRDATPRWRWTPSENWHVTLAFLGDVAEDRLDRLEESLVAAATGGPLRLRLDGAGAFPAVGRARHLFQAVACEAGDLRGLATHVRHAAATAGCRLTRDEFVAHVTVARTRTPHDATQLWRVLDTYRGPAWDADSFVLFRSELGAGRDGHPRYTAVSRVGPG